MALVKIVSTAYDKNMSTISTSSTIPPMHAELRPSVQVPPFVPHPFLWGGHAQTLGGLFLPAGKYPYRATRHVVDLVGEDQTVLHDDCPSSWGKGNRCALLIHGLSGSHASGYMERISAKMNERGLRTFRMDLRGCGGARRLSRLPYHSGQSEDAVACLEKIEALCPGSPVTVVGFSLGGNIVLKMLGECGQHVPSGLDSGISVCPPIDLFRCVKHSQRPSNRLYDRYFVRALLKEVQSRQLDMPGSPFIHFSPWPRSIYEFDEQYTAPLAGFGTADNYYFRCSSAPLIKQIRFPTLILTAADDPLIPVDMFERVTFPACVELLVAPSGGHLGFVGSGGNDPDRRWLDWRVLEWILQRLPHAKVNSQNN